ncbi:MAG: outer membrane protein assembly factor BamA [Deltaproteobacteria bacterium]|nr:outer membrane protein assembly factor BamA [Deltaproteobacteria bacterium]
MSRAGRVVAGAVAAALVWVACAWAANVVTAVRVRGNLRIEEGLILQKVGTRVGQPLDPRQVREDIRAIYGLGYFEDVVADLGDEGVLTFLVQERPALREWRAEGTEHLDPEDLKEKVSLRPREILLESQIQEAEEAIRALYREKGYYLAEVTHEIVPLDDGKNQVDLVFRVKEGEKVRLKTLNLAGVDEANEEKLEKYLALRPVGPWSWLSGAGTFQETDLERDREMIRAYYLNHGYAEAEVLDPLVSLTADRRWIKVDIPVREGEVYAFGTVSFSGDLEFSQEELAEAAGIREGDLFRSEDLRRAYDKVTDLYADLGYAFADVNPRTQVDRKRRTVDVTFEIHKGDRIRIGRIEVRGNTKTRDRVLRREMRLAEGDLYNATALRKSERDVRRLGFFEKVNVSTQRRPGTNLVDITIEVEEKPTGAFSFGAGYSSVDKIIGMANVSQRNFMGLGYQLALQANFGSTRETYSFTFNNPRVFDTYWYFGFDVYKSIRSYTDYDKFSLGGALKLGTALNEDWKLRGIYRLEEAEVKNVSEFASTLIQDQLGTTVTSSFTGLLIYDTVDNLWEPHAGTRAEWSVEWAGGLLGGDAAYLKYEVDASHYAPLWWEHVFHVRTRAGFVHSLLGRDIPVYERYYLGGINSLRGFDLRSIGPVDPASGDVIGGDKQILVNLEYLFPLIKEAKLRGVVFYDAGNAWDEGEAFFETGLRQSVGAGVRWFSPMGPLRLEWGYVLDRKPDEDQAQWEFTIGGFF